MASFGVPPNPCAAVVVEPDDANGGVEFMEENDRVFNDVVNTAP
jgi:hypothetical protein